MKKVILIVSIFIFISTSIHSQTKEQPKNKLATLTLDSSRISEDKNEFDYGLDVIATFYFDRSTRWEKFIRLEHFKNINYIKLGIGMQRLFPIYNREKDIIIELSAGVELDLIYREKPSATSWGAFPSYAFNGDIRVNTRLPNTSFIASVNSQRRTDFNMYTNGNEKNGEFVNSFHVGFGYQF